MRHSREPKVRQAPVMMSRERSFGTAFTHRRLVGFRPRASVALSNDIKLCLNAELHTTSEQAVSACRRAAETVGDARVSVTDGKITVALTSKSGGRKLESPILGVTITRGDGTVAVRTVIESYWTFQTFFFKVIPVGGQDLLGSRRHTKFLDALDAELRKADPHASVDRIYVPNTRPPSGAVKY